MPPPAITKYYWKTKAQLERLQSTGVFNIVGFCPQYNILLDDEPTKIEPENSSCATTLIVGWFACQIDAPTLSWDFCMDCRKAVKRENSGYSHCQPLCLREVYELYGLNNLLLQIARTYFNITIVGALSFHVESSTCLLHWCTFVATDGMLLRQIRQHIQLRRRTSHQATVPHLQNLSSDTCLNS